jgi:hypothetical protein
VPLVLNVCVPMIVNVFVHVKPHGSMAFALWNMMKCNDIHVDVILDEWSSACDTRWILCFKTGHQAIVPVMPIGSRTQHDKDLECVYLRV